MINCICKHCGVEWKSPNSKASHELRCKLNPTKFKHSEETKVKIGKSSKNKIPHNANKAQYNDGVVSRWFTIGETIPDGWAEGKLDSTKSISIEKRKATVLERYGVSNVFNTRSDYSVSDETIAKRRKTFSQNFANMKSDPDKYNEWVINRKLNAREWLPELAIAWRARDLSTVKAIIEKHPATNRYDLSQLLGISVSHLNKVLATVGLSDYLVTGKGSSRAEDDLVEFIRSFGIIVERNVRYVLRDQKELDIYIPSKNLAIEYNGLWCHGEKYGKNASYHLNKTIECNDNGLSLFHIWDYEWEERPHIIKSMLMAKLGIITDKIYARQCKVQTISSKESSRFFEDNHLQGNVGAEIHLGLFYNGELVSALTFTKPRFNKNYDWEIARFANKTFTQVVGGFSKLLMNFRKANSGSIITYSDKRLGGLSTVYDKQFSRLVDRAPGWFAYKNRTVYSRHQLMKHKLPKLMGDQFDPLKTSKENIYMFGLDIVYDCGQMVYELI